MKKYVVQYTLRGDESEKDASWMDSSWSHEFEFDPNITQYEQAAWRAAIATMAFLVMEDELSGEPCFEHRIVSRTITDTVVT